MKLVITILAAGAFVQANSQAVPGSVSGRQALYFEDNNPDGATIISLNISPETGLLSNPIRIPTGGKGMFAIKNGTTPPTGTWRSGPSRRLITY